MTTRLATLALAAAFAAAGWQAAAAPKGVPPGHGGTPPGLAKKGGLAPGLAKRYAVGENLPRDVYVVVGQRDLVNLPYGTQAGREWVRVGRDAYLIAAATGVIVDVLGGWFDR